MQSEVEAFLKQIRAYPDDDAPRLIFADWLEDQATTNHTRSRAANAQGTEWSPDRGRFIRIQIALARLREEAARETELTGLSKSDRALQEFEKEEQALEKKYIAEWIAPFQGLGPPTGQEFHRGFVEKLNIDAKDLVRHEHALFSASPLRHICLMNVGDCLPGVFRCSYLTRLSALTINHSRIGIPLARAIANAEHLAGLKKLHLTINNFDDDAIQHLVGSPILANLEELDLSENEKMGEMSARALASSPHLGALRTLELRNNRLGPVGAEAVAGSERLANLQKLVLSNNDIGIARLQTISRNAGFFRVPILDLSENKLDAAGLQVILNRNLHPIGPQANRLRDLNLRSNPLGDDGMRVLAACRLLENLRTLRLVNCQIGDEGVRVLAASPHLSNLVVLDLSNNPINDSGCRFLCESNTLRNLKRLSVPPIGLNWDTKRLLEQTFPDRVNRPW
jgi:uncharacterized protein (TIGR02996 family)